MIILKKYISCLLILGFLSSCGAQKIPKKVMEVIKNPDIQVGEKDEQPTKVDITFYAEPNSNKNDVGEPVPLDIWVFQLSDDGKFLNNDFFDLTEIPKETLGTTFIKLKEYQIEPEKSKIIKKIKLDEETTHIGIIGGYSDTERTDWRTIKKVKAVGEEYNMVVVFRRRKIVVDLH
jgi:type VI secretion system protein VasD